MFKTARFKVHNPSRHKSTMLWHAMTLYHQTLKAVLQNALNVSNLLEEVSAPDKKGKLRPDKYKVGKLVRTKSPLDWELAPLRDYLIGDATAMLMSHLNKEYKGANNSNPPTVPNLEAMTDEEYNRAYSEFSDPEAQLVIKPQHQKKIDDATQTGSIHVAKRLTKIYANYAVSRAAGAVLHKLEGALPHPIEFTHTEFTRGSLLAFRDGNYYLFVRLFSNTHRYCEKRVIQDGFIDCKTKQRLDGKKYPGLILPLEMSRDFHEREYLTHGSIQSTKLVVKRIEKPTSGAHKRTSFNSADYEFYVHAAFKFEPESIVTKTYLGIDRGAAKLGAATLIDSAGNILKTDLDLDGKAFADEMQKYEEQTRRIQKSGKQRSRKFSLRGKRADIILGEYANKIVAIAKENKSIIVIEAIKGVTMGRFLKQSQFAKLKQMLTYKAAREGLPAPVEVPAAYTSQTCSRCGHKDPANRPKKDETGKALQDVFRCITCGHEANADSNASIIIALRGLHQVANGGKFKKFDLFQLWLKEVIGRDGQPASGQGNQ